MGVSSLKLEITWWAIISTHCCSQFEVKIPQILHLVERKKWRGILYNIPGYFIVLFLTKVLFYHKMSIKFFQDNYSDLWPFNKIQCECMFITKANSVCYRGLQSDNCYFIARLTDRNSDTTGDKDKVSL